jgi:hypothetical protein
MSEIKAFVWGAMAWVLRLVLWMLAAVLAVLLLGVALVLLLLGVLWALVRGKRPTAPVFVGRFQRFTTERVWPGRGGQGTSTPDQGADVVDVEVREVVDVQTRLPDGPGGVPPDGDGRRS